MASTLLIIFAVVCCVVQEAYSCSPSYPCNKSYRQSYSCGSWWRSRTCYRQRWYRSTCYRTCPPVHGGWSAPTYSAWRTCSVTCGGGTQIRHGSRLCNNPAPKYGGNQCSGSSFVSQTQSCNSHNCPIDGGWNVIVWAPYGACTVSCGGGTKVRSGSRDCNNPAPQYGGRNCVGPSTLQGSASCNTHHCPIDGGWTPWKAWKNYDECSALCGSGLLDQHRSRECTNPVPQYGGADCTGESFQNQTIFCNRVNCGDKCPGTANTYIAHTGNSRRYYQCSNGVALLHRCAPGTEWSQSDTICVHEEVITTQATNGCPATGSSFMVHETDSHKFYQCSNGVRYEYTCPAGTYWAGSYCDFPAN